MEEPVLETFGPLVQLQVESVFQLTTGGEDRRSILPGLFKIHDHDLAHTAEHIRKTNALYSAVTCGFGIREQELDPSPLFLSYLFPVSAISIANINPLIHSISYPILRLGSQ